MPRLRFSDASEDDLKQIARFIAQDKPTAARQWVAKLREKCRLVLVHPEMGDQRPELGEGIRSTYVGRYVIYFRRQEAVVEIVRIILGDRDTPTLQLVRGTQRVARPTPDVPTIISHEVRVDCTKGEDVE